MEISREEFVKKVNNEIDRVKQLSEDECDLYFECDECPHRHFCSVDMDFAKILANIIFK